MKLTSSILRLFTDDELIRLYHSFEAGDPYRAIVLREINRRFIRPSVSTGVPIGRLN